ncbi:MAG TPA: TetR/AcrR family transcriptional regulator [Bordetella sp.]
MGHPGELKQARSIATRDALIAAALDLIYEDGYDAATTHAISQRAQVSRGALLYHFPNKNDIIIAAMDRSMSEATDLIRGEARRVAARDSNIEEFVDFVWRMFTKRFFYLAMEHITESRTNPELRERLLPRVRQFHEALDAVWVELYRDAPISARHAQVVLNMTVCLIRGMGVQTVYRGDADYFDSMLRLWKSVLRGLVEGDLDAFIARAGLPISLRSSP